MRIFECKKEWDDGQLGGFLESINFVDENNVLVGFETSQHCCESIAWYFLDHDGEHIEPPELEGVLFDPSRDAREEHDGDTHRVRFPLVDTRGKRQLTLVLENIHNGYYAHGVTVTRDGATIMDTTI